MSSTCENAFRFPRNPNPGMEICDKYGVIWRFDATINNWVGAGMVEPPAVVTEQNDGLITPEIKKKLNYLRENYQPNKPTLKLYPGTNAYWYYLRSSNKTIRFQPESEERLRIEVDHGRIYQLLYKVGYCPGKTGDDGDRGDQGDDGRPAPDELCFAPSAYDGLRLDFAMYVPTPLTLEGDIYLPNCHVPEVSVRLYEIRKPWDKVLNSEACEDQLLALAKAYKDMPEELSKISDLRKQAENICGIPLSQVLRILPLGWKVQDLWSLDIQVDITGTNEPVLKDVAPYIDAERTASSIKWDASRNIVCGSIYLKENAPEPFGQVKDWSKLYPIYSGWCLKARQKGPDGLPGDDADCRIKIIEDDINNAAIVATCPIINVRYDKTAKTIYYQCADLLTEYCAERVLIAANSDIIADDPAADSNFAAVEVTLDDCKSIAKTTITKPELPSPPKLNFIKWTPQGGCVTTRYFTSIKYDWNSTLAVNNKYPFPILYPTDKSEEFDDCCKEDFFYCKNIQNNDACPSTPSAS